MLSLALMAVLAAGDEALPPPPLVTAPDAATESDGPPPAPSVDQPNPARREPLPAPGRSAGRPAEPEPKLSSPPDEGVDRQPFSGTRVGTTAAVAGGSGAAIVGLGLFAATNIRDSSGSGVLLGLFSVPVAFFVSTALGLGVHRMMGGQGSYASSIAGGSIAGGIGLVATIAYLSSTHTDPGVPGIAAMVIGAGALYGLGVALMTELSHYRTLGELGLLSVVPTRGGAMAAVGFHF